MNVNNISKLKTIINLIFCFFSTKICNAIPIIRKKTKFTSISPPIGSNDENPMLNNVCAGVYQGSPVNRFALKYSNNNAKIGKVNKNNNDRYLVLMLNKLDKKPKNPNKRAMINIIPKVII